VRPVFKCISLTIIFFSIFQQFLDSSFNFPFVTNTIDENNDNDNDTGIFHSSAAVFIAFYFEIKR